MTLETSEIEAIGQRLTQVERQNRIGKRTALVILLVIGAIVAMGQLRQNEPLQLTSLSSRTVLELFEQNWHLRESATSQRLLSSMRTDEKRLISPQRHLGLKMQTARRALPWVAPSRLLLRWLKVRPRSWTKDQASFSVVRTGRY